MGRPGRKVTRHDVGLAGYVLSVDPRRSLLVRWLGACVLLSVLLAACGNGGPAKSTTQHQQTEASSATKPSAPKAVRLTVEVNGDLLIHSPVWEQALVDGHGRYDFYPMLREIAPYIKHADLAICHVETPMTPRPPTGYPVFNTPPALASAIKKTGWRICDTASNHSVDEGQYGIDQTGRALDRAGIMHTGSFPSRAAQKRTVMVTVKGVRIAFLAYTEMTNGIPLPHPWSVNLIHVSAVRRAARLARERGAQVVIVNFHWGDEDVSQPSAFQMSTARALAGDPDITAIVGQHVHVVQPIERVHHKLVVFGEGQLLSNETAACCPIETEDGMMVFLHILVKGDKSKVTNISYVPTWNRHPDYAVLPIGEALRRHQEVAQVLRDSYNRTVSVVGRIRHVVWPIPLRLP
jgi:poly-gamma-glutamate capsule biosynthesis protein CapA/YwtB (metallophosphatase superfamily)